MPTSRSDSSARLSVSTSNANRFARRKRSMRSCNSLAVRIRETVAVRLRSGAAGVSAVSGSCAFNAAVPNKLPCASGSNVFGASVPLSLAIPNKSSADFCKLEMPSSRRNSVSRGISARLFSNAARVSGKPISQSSLSVTSERASAMISFDASSDSRRLPFTFSIFS